jgi:hypothetical protein
MVFRIALLRLRFVHGAFTGLVFVACAPAEPPTANDEPSARSGSGGASSAGGGSGGATGGVGYGGSSAGGAAGAGNVGTTGGGGSSGSGSAGQGNFGGTSSGGVSGGSSGGSSGSGSGAESGSGGASDAGTSSGGTGGVGGAGAGGAGGKSGTAGAGGCRSGPIGTFSGALATGIVFMDTDGERVNAHGGGIVLENGTYYLHGERFLSTTTDNNFVGFSMYSSQNLSTWKNEGIILPVQPSGELGPNRKGERPHIIKCPATGEFVLFAHAASLDYQTDKEIVYATSPTVNGTYTYRGPIKNASGQQIVHGDMSAYADDTGGYVITESAHVFALAQDCHSWLSDRSFSTVNGDSGGIEAPTIFRAGGTYYWLGSYKTGWRANNNFYSTAPAITGPWTYRGYIAPVTDAGNNISDQRTWLSQVTWVQPIVGCQGTTYLYWGNHWDGTQDTSAPGRHNYLTSYVFQPLVFQGQLISLPVYRANWTLDVGAGTWAE